MVLRAQDDRKEILNYWRLRNKSNNYSKKLNQLFRDAIKIIDEHPHVGKLTDDSLARIKIVKGYLIIYEETASQIIILTIWDSRRDPGELKKVIS